MITKKQFIAWLESKKPRELVGRVGHCCLCPLANCLAERGKRDPWLESTVLYYGDPYDGNGEEPVIEENLPEWAKNFIAEADNRKTKQITAKTCLKIMGEI